VALANEMITVCSNETRLETVCRGIQTYSKEHFEWIKLCQKIDCFLNENDKKIIAITINIISVTRSDKLNTSQLNSFY